MLESKHCACKLNTQFRPGEIERLPPLTYQPLTSTHSTRVFELFPGKEGEPIRGHLREVDLDDASTGYVALSYTWGGTKTPHLVKCNGGQTWITCNLHSALSRLQDESCMVSLFADALCINQSRAPEGMREREAQVKLMKRIFPTAEYVAIDLGEEADNSHAVFELLSQISSTPDEIWNAFTAGELRFEEIGLPGFTDSVWDSLRIFCDREWFQRTWVVQEFSLAQDLKFLVGRCFMAPEVLFTGLQRLVVSAVRLQSEELFKHYFSDQPEFETRRFQMLRWHTNLQLHAGALHLKLARLHNMRDRCHPTKQSLLSLGQLLYTMLDLRATDMRDKVYAVLGICRNDDASKITVDYAEPVLSLSRRLSHFLIDRGQADVLLYNLASFEKSRIPSWMMDLEIGRQSDALEGKASLAPSLLTETQLKFQANGPSDLEISWKENCDFLVVMGNVLDEVMVLSEPYPLTRFSAEQSEDAIVEDSKSAMNWDRDTFILISGCLNDIPTSEVFMSFRSTLAMEGKLWDELQLGSERLSDGLEGHFEAYREFQIYMTEGRDYDLDVEVARKANKYLVHVKTACKNRCVCVTKNGRICIVPDDAQQGDMVAIFLGLSVPFVIREKDDHFRLVGTAYVNGVMNGEAFKSPDWRTEPIVLG